MGDLVQLPPRPADLVELESKRRKIRDKGKLIKAEIADIQDRLWRGSQGDADLDEAAAALIAGEEETLEGRPGRIRSLQNRLLVVNRADSLLSAQMADQRERHKRDTAAALRPAHRQAVAKIGRALLALEAANLEEQAIRDQAPGGPLPALSFPNIGKRGPEGAPISYWFQHIARFGYTADAELFAAE